MQLDLLFSLSVAFAAAVPWFICWLAMNRVIGLERQLDDLLCQLRQLDSRDQSEGGDDDFLE